MTVLITLTVAGGDTGPFNLYSDVDGYISAFETGVAKIDLQGGYLSALVPDGTTIIRVMSDGVCTNYVDIQVLLTTTTTTTLPNPATSILTFSNYESGEFTFTLSDAIYSTDITINAGGVVGYTAGTDCPGEPDASDSINPIIPVVIFGGTTSGSQVGTTPMLPTVQSWKRLSSIYIVGYGEFFHGETVVIDGTLVTIDISNCCNLYVCDLFKQWVGAKYNNDFLSICAEPLNTVYTAFGSTITTGTAIFTDSALMTPLVGYTYIVDPQSLEIFEIDNVTGIVGTDTLTTC